MTSQAYVERRSETLVNSSVTGRQSEVAVTALASGGFLATWTDASLSGGDASGTSIKGRLFDANGDPLGGEFLVNTATQNNQSDSAVTALASGGFAVTWTDTSGVGGDADATAVKTQLFDANGTRIGTEQLVNTATRFNQELPSITSLASGGYVISWTDGSATAPDAKGNGVRAQIYSAGGAKVGGEFLINSTITNSQLSPALTSLSSGGFVATWVDFSGTGGDASATGIKAQIFSATGGKVGGEFLVNTATNATQDMPTITTLSGGGFVVVWRDLSGQGDTSGAGLKAQIFNDAGVRVGGEFQVNNTTFNTQDMPTVVAMPDGGFTVSWEDNSNVSNDASGFGIKSQMFDATGNRIGSEFLVNTATTGDQQAPALAALKSGSLVYAWTDYSKTGGDVDGGIKMRILQPSPDAITGLSLAPLNLSEAAVENTPIATLAASGALNASYTYQIVNDPTGGAFEIKGNALVVKDSLALDFETSPTVSLTIRVTDTFGGSYQQTFTLQLSDAAIETRYAASEERTGNQTTAGSQSQPNLTSLQDGRYLLAWSDSSGVGGDASSYGVKGQILAANGSKIGSEFLVNAATGNSQDSPAAAGLTSGGFVLTWTDASGTGGDASGTGIKMQLFNASGAKVGAELLVNQSTANAQQTPTVAALSFGGYVVSWSDSSRQGGDTDASAIKAQMFDANGARLGGEFLVNSVTAGIQDAPKVTGLASGGFVISWRDTSAVGGDNNKDGVKAQIYDAVGARVGGEFLVNTETYGKQQQPTISALSSGGFVVAWADASQRGVDTDYFGIKVQVFDGAGTKVGGEALVNTTTAAGQLAPAITTLSSGGFVVSWADYSGAGPEAGTAGIKGQIFTASGAKVGGEFLVNNQLLGAQAEPAIAAGSDGSFAIAWTDYGGQGGDNVGTGISYRLFNPLPDQGGPPPLNALADTVGGTEDQALTIDPGLLIANDTSSSNTPIHLTSVSAPVGGAVALQADGTILFTPGANVSGAASFSYAIEDGSGATATGRVMVNLAPVNDAPTARADQVGVGQNGGSINVATLLGNDTDPDPGDRLALSGIPSTSAAGVLLSITNGTINYAPGVLFRSLAAGESATDSFTYSIVDSNGATSSATVNVTIAGVNDAPFAPTLSNASIDENAQTGTVLGTVTASDPDHGDQLRYSLINNAAGRFAIDAVTGVITYAGGAPLDYEANASHQIGVRVTDNGGLSVDQSFTVALNNLPEPKSYNGDNGANTFTASTNDLWTINGNGGNDILTGNASADSIYGGSGNDVIDGGGGADTMYGGTGNDTFYVDQAGDTVIEAYGEGTDLVYASIDFVMPENVEKLTQTGVANIGATGNSFDNTITGNNGDNAFYGAGGRDLIMGMDGNDTLFGEAGGDYLQGGNGDDVLVGGAGSDELTGGAGADRFVFDSLTVSADRDTVKDFTPGEDLFALDRSVFSALSSLAAGALPNSAFINGPAALTTDQRLVYTKGNGALYYDPDGSGSAAMIQIAVLNTKPDLTAHDFVLI
ncbi:beta strand repeat-containing protein [Sphingomonas aerophila]|uniref:VCBS repeat-containing protein n=1 Tax=Sphingomonas aerophila TaxID=1344948 RepID=A0A7W9BBV6_9SPHN|nr:tandem-95 repeat protein [Sphingomonas aerophila]MBB5714317.1 VCBS repeat-containing protein [Sphingomonas aerophila]